MITTENELFEDVKHWKGRFDATQADLDDALGIIYDLLGLEPGSRERAMKFLDDHSPTVAEVKGILPLPSSERANNNEQEGQGK